MSKSKSDISITQRLLLDFVAFKTKNDFKCFCSNQYIAKALDIGTDSTKVMINRLIRLGYLKKESDPTNHRILSLTGKEYKSLFINMSDYNKRAMQDDLITLKNDKDYYLNEAKSAKSHEEQMSSELLSVKMDMVDIQKQSMSDRYKISALEEENASLRSKVDDYELIFRYKGITSSEIDETVAFIRNQEKEPGLQIEVSNYHPIK